MLAVTPWPWACAGSTSDLALPFHGMQELGSSLLCAIMHPSLRVERDVLSGAWCCVEETVSMEFEGTECVPADSEDEIAETVLGKIMRETMDGPASAAKQQ